jgi:hypothetical protein
MNESNGRASQTPYNQIAGQSVERLAADRFDRANRLFTRMFFQRDSRRFSSGTPDPARILAEKQDF